MDAIQQYQQAATAMKAAIAEAERIARTVARGAAVLREWKTAVVSNVSVGFPMDVAVSPRASLDGREWPTGEQIAEALCRYHDAKLQLENAYSRIPEEERSVVQPPRTFY